MTDHGENEAAAPGVPDARERATDPRLLEMLACPLTKGRLEWKPVTAELVSRAARLAYPVRDGVPIMLPSEARPLDESELD
jgi:uncharacterized protein YbaR (Trm112 family)